MDESSTGFQASAFPNFRSFAWSEVPWWILCCRVYARSFSWRQVPAQVRLEEVELNQGDCPQAPPYPPEPVFTGNPTRPDEVRRFREEHRKWTVEVQELSREHQVSVMEWERRGMRAAQQWDLSPVPELAPFDSRPPELREWVPVKVFERQILRSRKASRVPTLFRSLRQGEDGVWRETVEQGTKWKPYATEELRRLLQGEPCIHAPETLTLAVPGRSFQPFLAQAEREVLALVRCRWDKGSGQLVQAGAVPQTFIQPAVEIVASVAVSDPGVLPVTRWPGLPTDLSIPGWEPGQQVPTTRAQFSALEQWVSTQQNLPEWYMAPEYRSLAAVNLTCSEARDTWEEAHFWRPLLEGASEDPDWLPSL